MGKQRRNGVGYGAKEYPAEFGLHVLVTKSEILGAERSVELKRRGLPYTTAVMDGGELLVFVFSATPSVARNAGGLMARAVGEMRLGLDAEDSLVAMMAAGDGAIYVQAKDDIAGMLRAYRGLWERAAGISVLEGTGLATGELPPKQPGERCGCPECAARGGW